MRSLCFGFCVLFTFFCVSAQQPVEIHPAKLFEKADLTEWNFFTPESGVKKEDVFSFSNEKILRCKGTPFGWLCTKDQFTNFKLTFQYRWPEGEKPTNSGIFLRMNGEPKTFLPRAVEAQLQHGNAGDLWAFHGMNLLGPANRFSDSPAGNHGKIRGVKRFMSNEKAAGEWNLMDILCYNGSIVVSLNGKIVNFTTDAEQIAGAIGIQSEGGPVEFQDMSVLSFDK